MKSVEGVSTVNHQVVTTQTVHYAAYSGNSGEMGGPWESAMDSSDFNHIVLLVA